jgi:DNA-binding transcriptional regulator YiaG
MRGLTLGDRPAIVIPTVPPAYRKATAVERHPLLMTDAELRCLREQLGLSVRELGRAVGRHERNVHRWESGDHAISRDTADELQALVSYTETAVADLAASHPAGTTIVTYRADGDMPDHIKKRGDRELSASWHRAVAWRAAQQTGATVTYPS